MTIKPSRKLLTLGCAAALAMTACGGDDDGGSGASAGADTEIGRALTANMLDEDSPVANEEEARCWSGRIVDGIGEDRLRELDVTPEAVGDITDIAFTDGEIDTLVDGLFDCADVRAAMASEFEDDFGEEGAKCVADEMDEELVSDIMKSTFTGSDEPPAEFFQVFLDIAAKCDLPLN